MGQTAAPIRHRPFLLLQVETWARPVRASLLLLAVLETAGPASGMDLVNDTRLLLIGGPTVIPSAVTNRGSLEVRGARVDVRGRVTNLGLFRVTDAEVHFDAPFANHGGYVSDPSDNYFSDLVIGPTGYLVGGAGDRFFVSGDLVSASENNTSWSTEQAALIFHTGADAQHSLSLTGSDLGPSPSGADQNFAWGRLEIAAGNNLTLVDGNATPGGALYAGEVVGAQLAGSSATNISGAAGLAIYYDPALAGNAYLGGATYDLAAGGLLAPLGAPAVPLLDPLARVVLVLGILATTLHPALRCRGFGAAHGSLQPGMDTRSQHPGGNTP